MTATKPATKPAATRAARTWTVYERIEITDAGDLNDSFPVGTVLLVQIDASVAARTATEACWKIAETQLRDRAQGAEPPALCASRNGTAQGLGEARPYALKSTVERVK